MIIYVFTDGSADNITKSCGGIGVYFNEEKYHKYNISKKVSIDNNTNQSMEILAALKAIKQTIKMMKNSREFWTLKIYTDSMYVVDIVTKYCPIWIRHSWKRVQKKQLKPIINLKLIKELYRLSKLYDIEFYHINSHQKEPNDKNSFKWVLWNGNKIADSLAKTAFKK